MVPKSVSSPLPSFSGITPINAVTILRVLKFFVLWGVISSGSPLAISPSSSQRKSSPPFLVLFQTQFAPRRFWISLLQCIPTAWLHRGEIPSLSLGWSGSTPLRLNVPYGQYPSAHSASAQAQGSSEGGLEQCCSGDGGDLCEVEERVRATSPMSWVNSPAFKLTGEGSNCNSHRVLWVLSPPPTSKQLSERFCFN